MSFLSSFIITFKSFSLRICQQVEKMIHDNSPFPHWENFSSLWSFSRFEELWSFPNQNSRSQVRGQGSLCLSEPVSISGVAGFKIPWENWQNRLRQKKHVNSGRKKTRKTLRRGSYRRAGRHVRTSWTCWITTAMLWKLEEKSKKVLRHTLR